MIPRLFAGESHNPPPTPWANIKNRAIWIPFASNGGNDDGGSGNGGDSGDGNGGGDDDDEFLNLQQAEEMAAAKGIELPEDYAAAARDGGLRRSVLQQYAVIASGGMLSSMLARTTPAFRDRLIADRLYFFKILAEVTIDSACATVAELRKRGDEFWSEFEFYLSDLFVGLVLDVVLVTLLAPVAVPGRQRKVAQAGTYDIDNVYRNMGTCGISRWSRITKYFFCPFSVQVSGGGPISCLLLYSKNLAITSTPSLTVLVATWPVVWNILWPVWRAALLDRV